MKYDFPKWLKNIACQVCSKIRWTVECLRATEGLITALATVLLAIVTGLLAWIAYWQYIALENSDRTLNETLVAANRATLAPLAVEFDARNPPEVGKPVSLILMYQNTGKEPALGLHNRIETGMMEPPPPGIPPDNKFGPNVQCDGLEPLPNGPVIYPSGLRQWATAIGVPKDTISERLIQGPIQIPELWSIFIPYVRGCMAYKTFGKTHRSGYCFFLYLEPGKKITDLVFRTCADGAYAD
jgi:hypothetical protein